MPLDRNAPILPGDLTSAQWGSLDRALTAKGFLSSRVEDAKTLTLLQRLCRGAVEGSFSPTEFRDEARFALEEMGYNPDDPEDEDTLLDLRSKRRLDLIYDVNVGQAQQLAWHNAGQTEAVLDGWPCQELYREAERAQKRDWRARWTAAGGRLYGGRMIARKDDPIWVRISRFGTPVPPFDFGSGMGIRDITRGEAERLGVIQPHDPAPTPNPINPLRGYQANASGISPELIDDIVALSGGLVEAVGSVIRWIGG